MHTFEVNNHKIDTPVSFSLCQNYPNPFNSSTVIFFSLSEATNVKLVVFNVNGKLIRVLIENIYKDPIKYLWMQKIFPPEFISIK